MYSDVKQKIDWLTGKYSASIFTGRLTGVEKESLRVDVTGAISQSDHPPELGCALTHPYITTDFSEALLEMVTPPCDSAASALNYLSGLHQYTVARLPQGEMIWNASMPCILRGAESVRIGQYGSSFSGRMKHAYRRGLALRYGKRMQAIAGIHFNHSMPDPVWLVHDTAGDAALKKAAASVEDQWAQLTPDEQIARRTSGYFSTMQNLLRIGWIIPYLFGASPAICASFLAEDEKEDLELWSTSTYYARYGTSLRMGKIGYRYREDQPIDLSVRHTSIDAYIDDIIAHVTTEHPPYAELGVNDDSGQRQQLSTARLQIENEFYSAVRPKQIAESGELPIVALRERGIRYLELRSVDVNPLKPVGLDTEGALLLEMLVIFAWLAPSVPLTESEVQAVKDNLQNVAHYGRKPGLSLQGPAGSVPLQVWGSEILDTLIPIAQWLDSGTELQRYTQSLLSYKAMINDSSETPSAKILHGIQSTGSFNEHTKILSAQHHQYFQDLNVDEAFMAMIEETGNESRARQQVMEEQSQGDFETFLQNYLLQVKSDVFSV